jgi:hypothetical protein
LKYEIREGEEGEREAEKREEKSVKKKADLF